MNKSRHSTSPTEATETKTGTVEKLKKPKNIIEKAINVLRDEQKSSNSNNP